MSARRLLLGPTLALLVLALIGVPARSDTPAGCVGTFGLEGSGACTFVLSGNPLVVSGVARGIHLNIDVPAHIHVSIDATGLSCDSQPGTGAGVAACANGGSTDIEPGTILTCRAFGNVSGAFECASGVAP